MTPPSTEELPAEAGRTVNVDEQSICDVNFWNVQASSAACSVQLGTDQCPPSHQNSHQKHPNSEEKTENRKDLKKLNEIEHAFADKP
ncbi:hypothetical protein C1H46_011881 [Malus baccata]|uniref:Uncharacterized protein n=1 Tax=Malus baccata TaxID=106549 RepID=A0A540MW47_MALBA|nr:hypothetical protein C1H46_011881 [Malus baccata]